MSYILDALKRANTERERASVPGLHTQPVPTAAPPAALGVRHWRGLILAAGLTLSALAAGLWLGRTPADDAPRTAGVPATVVAVAPVPTLTPLPVAAPTPPPPVLASQAPPPPAKPPVVGRPKAVKPSPASATAPPVPLLSELPADLRRQLPRLTITGAIYSKNPGQRLLLVNNQVLKQGGLAAPELNLEAIGERSSVFSFRGTQFRLAH